MQQTTTYQLNKIDVDDNFSPAPLNDNMDKVEAKFAALDAANTALDSRVTALEDHKVVGGYYTGNGNSSSGQTIRLGFTPRILLIQSGGAGSASIVLLDFPNRYEHVYIVENGFTVCATGLHPMNNNGTYYFYVAIK